jgi:hypothetical protein
MTNDVDRIPQGAVKCIRCKGVGELANGQDCPVCDGKGYLQSAAAMAHRADPDSWSDKPWSQFSPSDYSPEQWKSATLIHQGDGDEKGSHKLPVKEPDGTINKNAIHAAASRLNQVEGEGKGSAARKLASYYQQMGEEPPPNVEKLRADYENPQHPEEAALAAKQQLEAKLNKMPRDVDSRKKNSKGAPDDITETSPEGMPDPVNHTPAA